MPVCNLADLKTRLPKGHCLLGLDPGSTVIGVAICDPGLAVASPLTGIARKKFAEDAAALIKIIKERQAGGLVVGLPKNMDGSEGPAAQSVRTFVSNFLKQPGMADLLVAFWDERLSSAAVERFLISDDMTRKRRDQVIDKAAAAYILQGALDSLRNLA
jgi:putative Holliday junction resolvase